MPGSDTAARSVVIAVLTFRRPQDIASALPQLADQAASVSVDRWRVRVLVVDNDPEAGAREFVTSFGDSAEANGIPVVYVHEPAPGITAGRNRALTAAADDDVLIFIDDDERPSKSWLRLMLDTFDAAGSTAVVGPVVSEYEVPLSPWMTAGRFFDRRRLATGTRVTVAATNNLLLDLHAVRRLGLSFDPKFGISGGGDSLFTLQLVRRGGTMVWCDEAVVVDIVPATRSTPRWVLTRALRSGNHWVRTHLEVAAGPAERLRVRLEGVGRGLTRAVGGGVRAVWGALTRNPAHQAKGARTFARGAGMVLAVFGYTHQEYRRKTA